jgi:hypothetical protein
MISTLRSTIERGVLFPFQQGLAEWLRGGEVVVDHDGTPLIVPTIAGEVAGKMVAELIFGLVMDRREQGKQSNETPRPARSRIRR